MKMGAWPAMAPETVRFVGQDHIDTVRRRLAEVVEIANLCFRPGAKNAPEVFRKRFASGRMLDVHVARREHPEKIDGDHGLSGSRSALDDHDGLVALVFLSAPYHR